MTSNPAAADAEPANSGEHTESFGETGLQPPLMPARTSYSAATCLSSAPPRK